MKQNPQVINLRVLFYIAIKSVIATGTNCTMRFLWARKITIPSLKPAVVGTRHVTLTHHSERHPIQLGRHDRRPFEHTVKERLVGDRQRKVKEVIRHKVIERGRVEAFGCDVRFNCLDDSIPPFDSVRDFSIHR